MSSAVRLIDYVVVELVKEIEIDCDNKSRDT